MPNSILAIFEPIKNSKNSKYSKKSRNRYGIDME
jgi:hypothetical protein